MPFTAKDFKDHYVLSGRKHNPLDNKTLFDRNVNGLFSLILKTTTGDVSAIAEADEYINKEFESAEAGEELVATLSFNGRTVKNYPKQIKV